MSKSKIFLFFCLSFILGVGIAPYFSFSAFLRIFLILAAVIFIFVFWKNQKIIVFLLCFIFFIFGAWRYDLMENKITSKNLSYYNDKEEILFEGIISAEPDIRTSQTKLTLESKKIYLLSGVEKKEMAKSLGKSIFYKDLQDLPQKEIQGKILLDLPRHPEYNFGDQLLIFGKLVEPKESDNFSYKEYLSRYNIHSLSHYPKIVVLDKNQSNRFFSFLFKVKDYFEKAIFQILPEPHASFLGGLLLGAKKSIPAELMEKFNTTGMTHIVALSGYNISIIVVAVSFLFSCYFSRKISFWLSLLCIFLFVILTGMQASCVRAAIMGGLVALARTSGRFSNLTNSLVFAAATMLLINPKILSFDLGFQLSFLATCGIVYFSPYLERFLAWLPEFFQIRQTAIVTLSAQILVIPKILAGFSRVSLVSPFVNLLILPIIPATMFLGFLTGAVGAILPSFGKIFGYFAFTFLSYEIVVVDFFSKIPYASLQFEKVGKWGVWVYFAVVVGIFSYVKWKKR